MKRHFGPLFILTLLSSIIAWTNYVPGTWLTGWDTLHPELNFGLNIQRSLFGVWQEYQGLGLLGGMGHIAALPREILLWLISGFIPQHLLRYIWTFLMLLFGTIGAYALAHAVLRKIDRFHEHTLQIAAFAGGVFYLFNLNTLQAFVAPYEAFITHFAVLPWLLFSAYLLIDSPSKKKYLFFCFINIVGMTHVYVPTLFLVYILVLIAMFLGTIIFTKNRIPSLKKMVIIFLTTLCINLMWLLPFLYFTMTNSSVVVNSKINQMATSEIYLRNRKFGSISDTLTLKNFWFDTAEYNPKTGTQEYMLSYWIQYVNKAPYKVGIVVILSIVGVGLISCIKYPRTRFLLFIGGLSFLFLANDTPIFSAMNDYLRAHVPLLSQFFRFPFTKWGTTMALSESILFALAIDGLAKMITRTRIRHFFVYGGALVLSSIPILTYSPFLSGHLVSPMMKNGIPNEYQELFQIMKNKQGRIVYLPSPTYWDWHYYDWGYVGSGFIWYGLPSPILDNAFNSWSNYNENYYWELSYALYKKDSDAVAQVLDKYDIKYILLDENVTSPGSNRALFIPETKDLLATMSNIKEAAVFGKLTVYEYTGHTSKSFISLAENLPLVTPAYGWTDNDVAYQELGDYIAEPETQQKTASYEAALSDSGLSGRMNLSSNKSLAQEYLTVKESGPDGNRTRGIELDRFIPDQPGPTQGLEYQNESLSSTMNHKPITNNYFYSFRSLFTKRSVDEREFNIEESGDTMTIASKPSSTSEPIAYHFSKTDSLTYDSDTDPDNPLDLKNYRQCGLLREGTAKGTEKSGFLHSWPQVSATNQRGCLSFGVPTLPHPDAYLVEVESKHVSGRPMLFSIGNITAEHTELETFLPEDTEWKISYFILPPLAEDGLGYSIYVSNDAIGRQTTTNELRSIRFYNIPYNEMVSYHTPNDLPPHTQVLPVGSFAVVHPSPAYYKISLNPSLYNGESTTLTLSQSFHIGWKAYSINTNNPIIPASPAGGQLSNTQMKTKLFEFFPFLFGNELKEHVLVNNWENGWRLPEAGINKSDKSTNPTNEMTIVIFFLPQLLQWLGFALLPVPFLYAWRMKSQHIH